MFWKNTALDRIWNKSAPLPKIDHQNQKKKLYLASINKNSPNLMKKQKRTTRERERAIDGLRGCRRRWRRRRSSARPWSWTRWHRAGASPQCACRRACTPASGWARATPPPPRTRAPAPAPASPWPAAAAGFPVPAGTSPPPQLLPPPLLLPPPPDSPCFAPAAAWASG